MRPIQRHSVSFHCANYCYSSTVRLCFVINSIFWISDRSYLRITEQEFTTLPIDVSKSHSSCTKNWMNILRRHIASFCCWFFADSNSRSDKPFCRYVRCYVHSWRFQGNSRCRRPWEQVMGNSAQSPIVSSVQSPRKVTLSGVHAALLNNVTATHVHPIFSVHVVGPWKKVPFHAIWNRLIYQCAKKNVNRFTVLQSETFKNTKSSSGRNYKKYFEKSLISQSVNKVHSLCGIIMFV